MSSYIPNSIFKNNFMKMCIDRQYSLVKTNTVSDYTIYYFYSNLDEYVFDKNKRLSEISVSKNPYNIVIIYCEVNIPLVSGTISNIINLLNNENIDKSSFIQLVCYYNKVDKIFQEFTKNDMEVNIFNKELLIFDIPNNITQPDKLLIKIKDKNELRQFQKILYEDPLAKWFNLQSNNILITITMRQNGKIPYQETNIYQIIKNMNLDELDEENENQ